MKTLARGTSGSRALQVSHPRPNQWKNWRSGRGIHYKIVISSTESRRCAHLGGQLSGRYLSPLFSTTHLGGSLSLLLGCLLQHLGCLRLLAGAGACAGEDALRHGGVHARPAAHSQAQPVGRGGGAGGMRVRSCERGEEDIPSQRSRAVLGRFLTSGCVKT